MNRRTLRRTLRRYVRSLPAALFAFAVLPVAACAQEAGEAADGADFTRADGDAMSHPTVILETSAGDIRIELLPDDAPTTVENFLAYVDDGFYDGLIFHRVIPGFMIQAGGHFSDMRRREPTRPPIRNESDNGRRNLRGTVAMARQPEPHTASSQFFINHVDNPNLDHRGTADGWGYAVFGRVVEGMDVVDEIAGRPTETVGRSQNVPREPIVIESARRGADVEAGAD